MELLRHKTTKGEWFVEMSDLTIRVKEWEKNNLMGDYRGCIIADLKPSLGITWEDIENGCLDKDKFLSYLNGNGGRQHAWQEVLDNAHSICDIMNKVRDHYSQQ